MTQELVEEDKTADFINEFFSNIGNTLASKLSTPWTFHGKPIEHSIQECQTERGWDTGPPNVRI